MKQIVILGGGFAGVQAAIELSKNKNFNVVLVSNRDYLFLNPISVWIPTGELPFEKAKVNLWQIQRKHNFTLILDVVREIRSADQEVVCESKTIHYDYLIVAIGAGKVAHEGIENTLSICGVPKTALAIRDRLDRLMEARQASIAIGFGGNPKDKSAVRGGPAFELAFNIDHLLRKKRIRSKFDMTFFAPMEQPGIRMGAKAVSMTATMFERAGIVTRYGKKIAAFEPGGVRFEDDSKLAADLTLFIPGLAGHPVMAASDLPLNEAGFIKIDDRCLVQGTSNVYAVGDVAAIDGPEWRAKQGHLAEAMARIAVFNILEAEQGSSTRKGYREHLSIICLMDTGSSAALVYRDAARNFVVPLPIIGHWMKRVWGRYAALTKLGRFPRIPGL